VINEHLSTFRAMSELVADADDLLSRLGTSASPEMRALKERVEASVTGMKTQFRERVTRKEEPSAGAAMVLAVSAASMALLCFAAFKRRKRRRARTRR
jgi:ElaB/YqjD/DUF883 family membrane-anchored ribosome-binding protein